MRFGGGGPMASRGVSHRWLFRDLPQAYVVLVLAAACVGFLVIASTYWSRDRHDHVKATTHADYRKRYAGSILVTTENPDVCLKSKFDNRTGTISYNEYVKCNDDAISPAENGGIESARLRAVGKAFRRERD